MILVDTSVWIRHLRQGVPQLTQALNAGIVLMHIMVIGELACGALLDRERQLRDWQTLPKIRDGSHEDVLAFIDGQRLMGRGIGLVGAHLLYSVANLPGARLWTRDRPLNNVASELGVAYHAARQ